MSESSPESLSPPDYAIKALTESVIQDVLLKAVGPGAELKSIKIKDFCSKGDNLACYVTSVEVIFTEDNEERNTSFIAKLSKRGNENFFDTFAKEVFEKESRFYRELIPAMNATRETYNLSPLKYPSFFHSSFQENRGLIILEDMRRKSFRLADPEVDLDFDHAMLVVEELARLHSSSAILEEEIGTEKFLETYIFFQDLFTDEATASTCKKSITGFVQKCVRAAEKLEGYEKLVERLKEMSPDCYEAVEVAIRDCEPRFRVVNQGDCWKNNILFKYNGPKVVEVCLLDLQENRHASLAVELNHFFFTSVNGETRKNSLMTFLSAYYEAFKNVFDAAKKPMKFSLDELYEEYRRKNSYGVIMCFMSLAILGLMTEISPDSSESKDEFCSANVDTGETKVVAALDVNPVFRARLIGLLDEIEKHGIF